MLLLMHKYRYVLLLFIQPLLMTLINPNWLYTPRVLNIFDSWVYHALFRYLPDFANAAHVDSFYFIDRISWVLPGYLAYNIFPPEIANALLRFGVYFLTIFSLYGVAKRLFGQDVAFLTMVSLGSYTWFLRTIGHDYVDGVGIAYYSVALWFCTQAVYQRRYKAYLVLCGIFLGFAVITQLVWVFFLPLLGIYFLVLNHQQAKHPFITSLAWGAMGVSISLSLASLCSMLISGEWNIFINSVQFLMHTRELHDLLVQGVLKFYGYLTPTWLILPVVSAMIAIFICFRTSLLPIVLRRHLLLTILGFIWTVSFFIFLQYRSGLPYLNIYLYVSMALPFNTLLLAGFIAAAGLRVSNLISAFRLILIAQFFPLIVLINPIENILSQSLIALLITATGVILMTVALFFRKQTALWLMGFILMGMAAGTSNGVFYAERLKNYTLFTAVNDIVEAVETHRTGPNNFSELMVWYDADIPRDYGTAITYLYWGGSNFRYIQSIPSKLQLIANISQDVIILSDKPDIENRVQKILTGYFDVEQFGYFSLPTIDPSDVFRGYQLRLLRVDAYNEPIFPTGRNIFKSRYDYNNFVPAITGPEPDVAFQFRLPAVQTDLILTLCITEMPISAPDILPSMLNDNAVELQLSDTASSECVYTYTGNVPFTAIRAGEIGELAMNIPVRQVNSQAQGARIKYILFSTKPS